MELSPIFFIDHAMAFHLAFAAATMACTYALISFFKLASKLGRFAMDSQSLPENADKAVAQGVFLLRRHTLDARLPGTAA